MKKVAIREYDRRNSIVFLKTQDAFGGLSNMAAGYNITVNDIKIFTSEALYQSCRFPHRPDVQSLILAQTSPMTAKMRSKPFRDESRPDWLRVRVRIMSWCIKAKLIQNFEKFSTLLESTGDFPIVEQSRKDQFWGATPLDDHRLVGANVLGRLLMELRENIRLGDLNATELCPLDIPDFYLLGMPINKISYREIEPLSHMGELF